jgi:hypothetical protein
MDIDLVITWVNGSDPAWQAVRNSCNPPAESEGRYRELGLLPYWFRAASSYAPWARRIHFVTWGHVPPFLNREHPRLRIVRHEDFIPAEYLPTFNSHTIECHLHRIPGLSEHFIYFNDDMFLLRPALPEDFFREGLPCTCGREVPWIFRGEVGAWSHAAANDLGIINRHFPKRQAVAAYGWKFRRGRWQDSLRTWALQLLFPDDFTGFVNLHGPAPLRKQTFREVWAAEGEILHRTCTHRFRRESDVNQWVFLWWQVAGGGFCPREADNLVLDLCEENMARILDAVEHQRYPSLCVNDPGGPVPAEKLAAALERLLPEKSGFEV